MQFPRKLVRAATHDSIMPCSKHRKRNLSEKDEYKSLGIQSSNDEIYPRKKVKTERPLDDEINNNNHVLRFSFLSSFENTSNCSSSTSYQRRKSCSYINDPTDSQTTITYRPSTTRKIMLVCQPKSFIDDNNNENEQSDKNHFFNFITSTQLSAYLTSTMNIQNGKMLVIDCGSPLRYNERRIKESFLLNINDKLSRKRLVSRGLKNFLDQNQLNRLNQSEIIILYDDFIQLSSSLCSNSTIRKEISPVMKCIVNEIQKYDSNKTIYVLQSTFDEFHENYSILCYTSSSNSLDNDTSSASQTTDIESYTMSEVMNGLYLGNAIDAKDRNALKKNNIKAIVNISATIPCYYENDKLFDYLQVTCHDLCRENILQYLDSTLEFIHNKLLQNENILVHCQAGISRSPSFVIGYLMKYHSKTFDQAYSFVKEKRKIINPNLSFLTQLTNYEQMLK